MRPVLYADCVQATRQTLAQLMQARTGRALDVQVDTQGGTTARVNLDRLRYDVITVSLPTRDLAAWLTRAEADHITAYAVHELLHVLHTSDNGLMAKARQIGGPFSWLAQAASTMGTRKSRLMPSPIR